MKTFAVIQFWFCVFYYRFLFIYFMDWNKKNIVCLYHEEEGREILKTYSEEKIQNKEEEEK